MDTTSILAIACAVLPLVIQLVLAFVCKRWWVHLFPILPPLIATGVFFALINTVEGWDVIGYILLFAFAGGVTVSALVGFLIAGIIRIVRHSCKKRY